MEGLEATRTRSTTHRILVAVGLVVTVVFGYFAVRDAHLRVVWDTLLAMQAWWLVPAALLLALCVLLRAVRWRSLFVPSTRPPLRETLNALLLGADEGPCDVCVVEG